MVWWVTRGRAYPVPSVPRRSRHGVGAPARSARWVLQLDPLPHACFEASSPTRRDTRFRPARPAAANTPRTISVPLPRVNHGQWRGTVTRLDQRSRSLTAQWARPSKLACGFHSRRTLQTPLSILHGLVIRQHNVVLPVRTPWLHYAFDHTSHRARTRTELHSKDGCGVKWSDELLSQ